MVQQDFHSLLSHLVLRKVSYSQVWYHELQERVGSHGRHLVPADVYSFGAEEFDCFFKKYVRSEEESVYIIIG